MLLLTKRLRISQISLTLLSNVYLLFSSDKRDVNSCSKVAHKYIQVASKAS
jgi:hypothetical protein